MNQLFFSFSSNIRLSCQQWETRRSLGASTQIFTRAVGDLRSKSDPVEGETSFLRPLKPAACFTQGYQFVGHSVQRGSRGKLHHGPLGV